MPYLHPNQAFIFVGGEDAFTYLQNIISNDIKPVHQHQQAVYSLLLNSKGKYKFDFFVWPYENKSYLIETSFSQKDGLLQMLKFYKLRAKVIFEPKSDVYTLSSLKPQTGFISDPRHKDLYRSLCLKAKPTDFVNSFDYSVWRLQNGLPEYDDLITNEDTPIEMGFDELNAITYSKGCFLGQEGTNKAKHRLIIKKRLLPFQADGDLSKGEIITDINGKEAGIVRSFKKGYGLALIKLKYLHTELKVADCPVQISIPEWISLES